MSRYWICRAAQEHVDIVKEKGYTQVNGGPKAPLEKMSPGDWIIYYSPTIYFEDDMTPCHKFTGISSVVDTFVYPQSNQFPDRWRRNVDFYECKPEHPERFLKKVTFMKHNDHWRDLLSEPIFEISEHDFHTIAQKILVEQEELCPVFA